MKIFRLEVFGNAVPEGRARTVRTKVGVKTYTPKKTQGWRDLVRSEAQRIVREEKFVMFPEGEALMMSAEFVYDRPKSVSEAKRPHMVVKPDVDNLIKNVKDALSGVAYHDDKQVIGYVHPLMKRYCKKNEQPHMTVWVYGHEDWLAGNIRISALPSTG